MNRRARTTFLRRHVTESGGPFGYGWVILESGAVTRKGHTSHVSSPEIRDIYVP